MGAPRIIPPEREADALTQLAQGATVREVAQGMRCHYSTISRLASRAADYLGALRRRFFQRRVENVLQQAERPMRTLWALAFDDRDRIDAKGNARPRVPAKDRIFAIRTAHEIAGLIGQGGTTVYGDVNVDASQHVDLSQSVNLEASAEDVEQLRARLLSRRAPPAT